MNDGTLNDFLQWVRRTEFRRVGLEGSVVGLPKPQRYPLEG